MPAGLSRRTDAGGVALGRSCRARDGCGTLGGFAEGPDSSVGVGLGEGHRPPRAGWVAPGGTGPLPPRSWPAFPLMEGKALLFGIRRHFVFPQPGRFRTGQVPITAVVERRPLFALTCASIRGQAHNETSSPHCPSELSDILFRCLTLARDNPLLLRAPVMTLGKHT